MRSGNWGTGICVDGQYEIAVKPYKVIKRAMEFPPYLMITEIESGIGHSMIHQQEDWVTSREL